MSDAPSRIWVSSSDKRWRSSGDWSVDRNDWDAEMGFPDAEYLRADLAEALAQEADAMEQVSVDLGASLAAAISLLERGGRAAKKAAPSDRMFDQMLADYRASLARARAALLGDAQ